MVKEKGIKVVDIKVSPTLPINGVNELVFMNDNQFKPLERKF